jgi:hypothetical protein
MKKVWKREGRPEEGGKSKKREMRKKELKSWRNWRKTKPWRQIHVQLNKKKLLVSISLLQESNQFDLPKNAEKIGRLFGVVT